MQESKRRSKQLSDFSRYLIFLLRQPYLTWWIKVEKAIALCRMSARGLLITITPFCTFLLRLKWNAGRAQYSKYHRGSPLSVVNWGIMPKTSCIPSLPITLGSTFRFIAETITKQPRIENIGRFQGNECQVRSWIWRRISHWEPCSPVSTAPVPDSTIEVSGIPLPFPTHVLVQWPLFTCHW